MTGEKGGSVWHIDRTINLSVIFVVIAQFSGLLWWVSGVSNRVDNAVTVNEQQNTRIQAVEAATNSQAISAATTSAQLAAVRDSLAELKAAQSETNRLLRELAGGGARP